MKHDSYPVLQFVTQDAFEKWLSNEFATAPGVWLKFAKKGTGVTTVIYKEALDVALCYGWIDGQSKKLDETFYLQKFTPRGKKSMWSKINREHVARLIKEKKMQASGLIAIAAAKKDGRWESAYDSPKNMVAPEEFVALIKKHPKAWELYQTLNKTNKYAIAFQLNMAKKPETKERRMQKFLEMLQRGEKLY